MSGCQDILEKDKTAFHAVTPGFVPYLLVLTVGASVCVMWCQGSAPSDVLTSPPGDAAVTPQYNAGMSDLETYLEELDHLLLDQGDDWMLLTQLDGFLAGILVSPDTLQPGEWLKHIWAGEGGDGTPEFEDMDEFQHVLDLIMHHYNEILHALNQPGSYEPVFDVDMRNDDILWEMWIEGFMQAMEMAPNGWRKVTASDDAGCIAALKGIAKLHAIANGEARLSRSKQDQWTREAPDLIPVWVEMLHVWRLDNDPDRPTPVRHGKVGRNDPCPCGSGKKYKKCCGLN